MITWFSMGLFKDEDVRKALQGRGVGGDVSPRMMDFYL